MHIQNGVAHVKDFKTQYFPPKRQEIITIRTSSILK